MTTPFEDIKQAQELLKENKLDKRFYIPASKLGKQRRFNPIGRVRVWLYARRLRKEIEQATDLSAYLTKTTYRDLE